MFRHLLCVPKPESVTQGGKPLAPDVAISPWPTQVFTLILSFNDFLAFLPSLTPFVPYPKRPGLTCPVHSLSMALCLCLTPRKLGFSLSQGASLFRQAYLVLSFLWSNTKLRKNQCCQRGFTPHHLDASWINKCPRGFCSFTCHLTQQSRARDPKNKRHGAILYI